MNVNESSGAGRAGSFAVEQAIYDAVETESFELQFISYGDFPEILRQVCAKALGI